MLCLISPVRPLVQSNKTLSMCFTGMRMNMRCCFWKKHVACHVFCHQFLVLVQIFIRNMTVKGKIVFKIKGFSTLGNIYRYSEIVKIGKHDIV